MKKHTTEWRAPSPPNPDPMPDYEIAPHTDGTTTWRSRTLSRARSGRRTSRMVAPYPALVANLEWSWCRTRLRRSLLLLQQSLRLVDDPY